MGTLDHTLAYGRDVFRTAILKPVTSIVLAHNHPSGTLEPSTSDKILTKKLVEVGEVLKITVVDHIIFTEYNAYFSFAENNLL